LRDSDVNLSLEQRAMSANSARAQFYISIHATSMGTGVKVYTALLPPRSEESRGPFLPWGSAQYNYVAVSQNLASSLTAELTRNLVAVRSLSAPLPPLNHIACAAVAVEIASPGTDLNQLNSAAYQDEVANALTAGILAAQKLQVTP
jgi:N-acetylmuramoyl-L-alanine amidase